MANKPEFKAEGVIPACLLPFKADLEIDEAEFSRHLRWLAATPGVTGICVNGHSCEVHTLTSEERERVVALAVESVGRHVPIIAGIYADGSRIAADLARQAGRAGAAALLVFPSHSTAKGGRFRQEMFKSHVRVIAEASELPLLLFQYNYATGMSYEPETLLELCEEVPSIVGIKDGCGEPLRHARQIRDLHALARPVKVLSTHSTWLLGSLAMGCDGLLSGAGSVIADLQAAMFQAVQSKDLGRAQELDAIMHPLVRAFYATPYLDMHNRMKEVLAFLGRLERAVVRPPQCKIPADELQRLRAVCAAAGLNAQGIDGLDWPRRALD